MKDFTVHAAAMVVALGLIGAVSSARAAPRVVPTDYPTIQSAIEAAVPGDSVIILPGTYTEQLRISQDLVIVGADVESTFIRAPAKLRQGKTHDTSIVEIFDGASVTMSRLTVSGPGAGTCKKGALAAGIRVHSQAHLDFSVGAVRDIHDSPMGPCFHSGTGILVGDVPGPPATLDIRYSEISNYQSAGIVVLGFGSTANIVHNIVVGPGRAGGVGTDGIEFPVGSVGTIAYNTVSGNFGPPAARAVAQTGSRNSSMQASSQGAGVPGRWSRTTWCSKIKWDCCSAKLTTSATTG